MNNNLNKIVFSLFLLGVLFFLKIISFSNIYTYPIIILLIVVIVVYVIKMIKKK